MKNRIHYPAVSKTPFFLIATCIALALCACKADAGIKPLPGTKVFGTKYTEGFFGTHSRGYNSLMVKRDRKWVEISIKLDKLVEMAKNVITKNRLQTFRGNSIFN